MYELIKLTEHTYYIESPAKVGVVLGENNDVFLIDSGNDKDAGKKILKILTSNGWNLKAIFNTHYHADHIGGNAYLQRQTGCKIYAPETELGFVKNPVLEPAFLYGGNPPKELKHKFLMAENSNAELLTGDVLPEGMEIITLGGHSFNMVGFKTADGVVFLADCLSGEATLEKYKIGFITDIGAYIETLEKVKNMTAVQFVPSHSAVTDDIVPLAQFNINSTLEIVDDICEILQNAKTFEELLQCLFSKYELKMTFEQYALVGSTVKSYLTYLKECGKIAAEISSNRLMWKSA